MTNIIEGNTGFFWVVYSVLMWLGTGIILAKEAITGEQPVYLKDSWAFILISLVAPLIAFAGMVAGWYERRKPVVLFKKKETK